jgi:hypothetical protein
MMVGSQRLLLGYEPVQPEWVTRHIFVRFWSKIQADAAPKSPALCRCVEETLVQTPVPVGHGIVAHSLLGWCAGCPGRSILDELTEWRGWAFMQVDVHATASATGEHHHYDQHPGDPTTALDLLAPATQLSIPDERRADAKLAAG